MDPVVHFEMPYENSERLVKFYKPSFRVANAEARSGHGGLRNREYDGN